MPPGFQPLADLKISSQSGLVDSDVPFQPLGALPVCGSYLTVESAELLKHDWDAIVILIDWAQPQGRFDFAAYYDAYNAQLAQTVFSDGAFRLQASWQTPSGREAMQMSDSRLFQPVTGQDEWVSRFVLQSSQAPGLSGAGSLADHQEPGRACVRLELTSPAQAFGHALYAQVLQGVIAANASSEKRQSLMLPNPPFVPLARRLRAGVRLKGLMTNASQTAP